MEKKIINEDISSLEYFSEKHFKPFKIDIKNCLNFVLFAILTGLFYPVFFEFKKKYQRNTNIHQNENF